MIFFGQASLQHAIGHFMALCSAIIGVAQAPARSTKGDLRWSNFLRLHAQGIIACDFFVAVTATFRLLYVSW